MNFFSKKNQVLVVRVIVIILVLAMIMCLFAALK